MDDDDDFDDLFSGEAAIPDSSQEPLTDAAANLSFDTLTPPSSWAAEAARPSTVRRITPQHHIEAFLEQIVNAIVNEEDEISITLGVRRTSSSLRSNLTDQAEKSSAPEIKTRRLCFPGKTEKEAWRFTVVLRLLELMHEALSSGVVLSKRDLYYRDPALFGSQAHVDRFVDDIAFSFGVPRSALNVTAVAKGLVVGAITFCRRDGSQISAAGDREGMLVPNLTDVLSVDMRHIKWVVVVEKEATFRSIAASRFWEQLITEGVLITGKGYPDIASRALLHFLNTPSPQNGFASPPVFGLADFDPDGLAILSVYKHGSAALAHESAALRVPQLKWLGLRSEHLMLDRGTLHANQGLLSLTARDRKKARKMLEHAALAEDGGERSTWRREVQVMLMLNVKAEMQLLDATPDGMTDLLNTGLSSACT